MQSIKGSAAAIVTFILFQTMAYGQDSTSVLQLPSKYLDQVSAKANHLGQKLDKKSEKALLQFAKEEEKIKRKLLKIDSLSSNNIFAKSQQGFLQLEERLKNPGMLTQYIPHLDSIATSFKFLQENPEFLSKAKDIKEKLKRTISKIDGLKNQLQKAEEIKRFLKEQKEFLKEQLSKFGFAKELKRINKQAYYYGEQIKEYKTILEDPKKIERKAIELLSKTRFFQDFMRKNSMLASLFRIPGGDPNDPLYQASFAGLQTRAQVNNLIQQQISAGGSNAQSQFQQNIQQAQAQLQQLKNKVIQVGGVNSDDIIPQAFKPNNQKTKSFLKRLEYGTNIQTQRARYYFPITSDLGLSIGYKLNDKSIIGIGASYKLGWGKGWNNIKLTQEGAGLRSYVDWKLKGSFWISGGYELNYRTAFNNITQLQNFDVWQRSGLIGLSKVIAVKTKFFKKTKLQLLWDFLSYHQVPRTQPIVFRIGYNF